MVGRAFFAAYKQAAASKSPFSPWMFANVFYLALDAAAGGGVTAAARGGKDGVMDALTRKTGMSLEEACQILNVQKDADLTQLTKVRGAIVKKVFY